MPEINKLPQCFTDLIQKIKVAHFFIELECIYTKFCTRGHLVNVINRAKFYLSQIRGFDSVRVEFLASP